MTCIVAPEIATVGQSSQAYLQRIVVIVLSVACISISYYNFWHDCQIFKWVLPDEDFSSSMANFSKSIDQVFEDIGWDVVDSSNRSSIVDEELEDIDVIMFGIMRYKPVDEESRKECRYFEDIEKLMEVTTEEESNYYDTLFRFARATRPLAVIGILFAMVELLFCICYPSVIIGAIFLSMAACTETAWLLMHIIDHRKCFTDGDCTVALNFFTYLFVIGGFFFSSNLLIFGLRTYPWCMRKNRDPNHCRVVEAEIVSIND